LIAQVLDRRQQMVVFSAFNDPLDTLSRYLRQAGVVHAVLEGRTNQKRRGQIADQFKRGRWRPSIDGADHIPVLLAGVECMAEGHNFALCSNVILMAYSWAFDIFYQAIKRVHRLTSPAPVNLYSVICDGSVDRQLENSIAEKGDAAELVLDGRLLGERAEELNLAQLLESAVREFTSARTLDEDRLETDWPALRARLAAAAEQWPEADPIEIDVAPLECVPVPFDASQYRQPDLIMT
jgi:SNF2 family DNA or RNA helicase